MKKSVLAFILSLVAIVSFLVALIGLALSAGALMTGAIVITVITVLLSIVYILKSEKDRFKITAIIITIIMILLLLLSSMYVFRPGDPRPTVCTGFGGTCMENCTGEYPLESIGHRESCGVGKACCLPESIIAS